MSNRDSMTFIQRYADALDRIADAEEGMVALYSRQVTNTDKADSEPSMPPMHDDWPWKIGVVHANLPADVITAFRIDINSDHGHVLAPRGRGSTTDLGRALLHRYCETYFRRVCSACGRVQFTEGDGWKEIVLPSIPCAACAPKE